MTPCPLCRSESTRPLFEKAGYPYERCARCRLVTRGGPEEPPSYHDYLPEATTALPELTRRRYEDLLDRLAPYRRTGRFLDVGCGGGFLVESAADRGWEAEGLEVSQAAVDFGRERGLKLECGTLDDVPLPAGAYDLITLMEVIEHVRDPVGLLRRARELLRPGGALYLTTPNWRSLTRRLAGRRWTPIGRDHLIYFTPRALRCAMADAGLHPVHMESANLDPHQFLARLRGDEGPAAEDPARWERTESLRQSLEDRPFLGALKRATNAVLGLTGTGDTIRALAERSA